MINAFVNVPVEVAAGAVLPFAGSRAVTNAGQGCRGGWLYHNDNSGLFLIARPGIYKLDFAAQVTAAAAGDIALAVSVNGEALPGSAMGAAIAAADDLADVGRSVLLAVPCGASQTVSIANTGETEITVNSASLVLTRVA